MTGKETDRETKLERERRYLGALGRMSEICTFLAAIFFTCILLIVQQKEKFEYSVEMASLKVRAIDMISLPLSVTFLLFVFDALFFAIASQSVENANLWRNRVAYLFYLGLALMLISLFTILAQISLWIALIGIGQAIVLMFYFGYGVNWRSKR